MGRAFALIAALAMVGLIAYLTIGSMLEKNGIGIPFALLSLVILLVIGIGVVGALTHPPNE